MGKKRIISVTYENERISIKNRLPYLKCVLRLSLWSTGRFMADLWPFYWFLCQRFSLYIKVYQGRAPGGSTAIYGLYRYVPL